MTPNQYPHSPEEDESAHPIVEQFNDGDVAIIFRNKGDHVSLGMDSPYRLATDLSGFYMAIITTEDNKDYGVALGLLVTGPSEWAGLKPLEPIDITIGEPCELLNVLMVKSPVRKVQLYSEFDALSDTLPIEYQVDEPSPFPQLLKWAQGIRDTHPHR